MDLRPRSLRQFERRGLGSSPPVEHAPRAEPQAAPVARIGADAGAACGQPGAAPTHRGHMPAKVAGEVLDAPLNLWLDDSGLDVSRRVRSGARSPRECRPALHRTRSRRGWTEERAGGGFISGVSERARREFGAWPSPHTLVDQLAAALARAADEETEPRRRSRLREAAEVLGGMARDIAVNVLSAKIGQP
jgi:hypothetical protein